MKHIFQINGPNKVLFKNFTSLSLLQISNYIFPLITLPYLVRVLGPEKYGLINFAAAFTGYFTILTDYGFNLSATQEISINREDKQKVSEIFSSVISIKILFFLLSSLIFLMIVLFIPLFNENVALYFVTFLSVLGTTLFPSWLYQGVERMKYILNINLSVRIIITILIFILIKSESDYLKLAALNTIAQFSIGVVGILLTFKKLKIKYFFPNPELIKAQLKNGLSLFLSTVSINLYTTSNIFILGLFAPLNVVGYFSAADKIRMACQSILSPMSQSVFPYVNKMVSESYERFISFNKKLFKIALIIGAAISILLFLFAEPIVNILLGHEYQSSILVLKIIAWLPMVIFLSNVLGIQTMIPLNKQKSFALILFFAAVLSLTLSFILVPKYFEIGTSISVLATEIFVTVLFFVLIKKNKILIV